MPGTDLGYLLPSQAVILHHGETLPDCVRVMNCWLFCLQQMQVSVPGPWWFSTGSSLSISAYSQGPSLGFMRKRVWRSEEFSTLTFIPRLWESLDFRLLKLWDRVNLSLPFVQENFIPHTAFSIYWDHLQVYFQFLWTQRPDSDRAKHKWCVELATSKLLIRK